MQEIHNLPYPNRCDKKTPEGYPLLVKHLKNFPSIFGRHLIFVNILHKKYEGSYAYKFKSKRGLTPMI
jgi:hypothetical protein